MSVTEFFARRWARRAHPINGGVGIPSPAAGRPARLEPHLQALLDETHRQLSEGEAEPAFPLLRTALADPALTGTARGEVAATLGWALLEHYPGDPVPDEAREALAVALRLAPRGQQTHALHSFILLHDGDSGGALRCASATVGRAPIDAGLMAQVLCIKAAAHHELGEDALGSKSRECAAQIWPDCDLLPWLEERTSR
jgi:hypothetical protein